MWFLALFACSQFDPGLDAKQAQNKQPIDEQAAASSTEGITTPDYPSTLVLDGKKVAVHWDDGDTFAVKPDNGKKAARARLNGFNTLESYGPVHAWGNWSFDELYAVAKQAGKRAASEEWTCTQLEGGGGYGRLLVDCPDLRLTLLREGLAHNFAVEADPEAHFVAAQEKAVNDKVGMWAQGAPNTIVTSLHSADEYKKDGRKAYDRVVSIQTGKADKFDHEETYEVCQRVCHGGSCMLYVPFEFRHGADMAECLKPNSDGTTNVNPNPINPSEPTKGEETTQ